MIFQTGSKAFIEGNLDSFTSEMTKTLDLQETEKCSGTGFFITGDGYLITNHHVVKEHSRLVVATDGDMHPAELIKSDPLCDLAILKVCGEFGALPIISSDDVCLGDSVFTIGFPHADVQGLQPKFTRGEVSSLSGIRDDPREFQISVAVQPGNSGGPLVNEYGNVVGVVVARLNDITTLQESGFLPQNVNYAVKSDLLLDFLSGVPGAAGNLKRPQPPKKRKMDSVVRGVQAAAVRILVY